MFIVHKSEVKSTIVGAVRGMGFLYGGLGVDFELTPFDFYMFIITTGQYKES